MFYSSYQVHCCSRSLTQIDVLRISVQTIFTFLPILFFFVSDQNAGTGQSAAGQYDVQLHQHLPDGRHQGAVESEFSL